MEKLLELTGPIELPQYGMVVDARNFIPTIQEQVEVKYDKEENKPKKVLADLASVLMERVFSMHDPLLLYQLASVFVTGLNERQVLLYTRNEATEDLIRQAGWAGEIKGSAHDYLSVVHTNLNGYKTDGVVEDSLTHKVEIQTDGSVVATTRVVRVHTGGQTPYDWWNKVSSDYMRVYVPEGSQLISTEGATREFPPSPLDYVRLGFHEDADVLKEEQAITLDEKSGTRVGQESGKTVFGNWVYVSPGETVAVEYTYLLPFRVDPKDPNTAGYSFLFQKQAGVDELKLRTELSFPEGWQPIWQSAPNLIPYGGHNFEEEQVLRTDHFTGFVFGSSRLW
jgi:hypothetical protein